MKIKKLRFSIKEHREWDGDFDTDYVRPLFFFTWSLYFVGCSRVNNLGELFLVSVSYLFLGVMYLCIDILLFPYKLLSLFDLRKNE